MDEPGMYLDPQTGNMDPLATPDPTTTPESQNETITVTLGMWSHLLHRLSTLETALEGRYQEQEQAIETLNGNLVTLKSRHNALEREHYERAPLLASTDGRNEPKIPDPPMYSGDRKELAPFLTKCQLKFEGQPSRFRTERSKILYAGSRLEGTPFSWFQPLITQYGADSETPPPELVSFKTFKEALTGIYGDPNQEATAVRELRRLHQTGSAAEYAARFEAKRQYIHWNDQACRDQFYLNLKEDIKDEMAPVGKPTTYADMKALAIRLDTRLYERRLERSNAGTNLPRLTPLGRPTGRSPAWTAPANNPAMPTAPTPATTTQDPPSTGLRVPTHTPDGTVPMELGASGFWHLTELEKERRRSLGLCGYCGEKGHMTYTCPVAPPWGSRHQIRSNRVPAQSNQRTVMNFQLSEPEKDDTQE